ncbi:hypothetical protein CPAR01_13649 [Colletotrichum paranaense]|uniref:Uncharacterized protein n=1 Tax=Colletotrichum paranaense TaxID=1914294 RepID=A0ABQ9S3Y9_9PEZI|nr:uncharacterized protein CPAR01_13649 [Colletotrichum paranaense]KAK1524701.1 hypothetical protein CPAR01_13649 [Colletotrichum paranaense]
MGLPTSQSSYDDPRFKRVYNFIYSNGYYIPLLSLRLHPNNDFSSSLFDDQGHFLANEFACKLQRHLFVFGWKIAFRFGHQLLANLQQLQKLGFYVDYPVAFNLRLHTPSGYLRNRLIEIIANAHRVADTQPKRKERRS